MAKKTTTTKPRVTPKPKVTPPTPPTPPISQTPPTSPTTPPISQTPPTSPITPTKTTPPAIKKEDVSKINNVEKAAEKKREEDFKRAQEVIVTNTSGEQVLAKDYFHKGVVPAGFKGTCGKPVDREDLLNVFNKVFKPSDNILFYKQIDKEVYIIIIPLKYSTAVGDHEDSLEGDFQKHAISFLNEGSVNLDTMRKKLEKITNFVKYTDR